MGTVGLQNTTIPPPAPQTAQETVGAVCIPLMESRKITSQQCIWGWLSPFVTIPGCPAPPSSSCNLLQVSFKCRVWPAIRPVSGSIRAVRGIVPPGLLCLLPSTPAVTIRSVGGGGAGYQMAVSCPTMASLLRLLSPSPLSWRGQGQLPHPRSSGEACVSFDESQHGSSVWTACWCPTLCARLLPSRGNLQPLPPRVRGARGAWPRVPLQLMGRHAVMEKTKLGCQVLSNTGPSCSDGLTGWLPAWESKGLLNKAGKCWRTAFSSTAQLFPLCLLGSRYTWFQTVIPALGSA